MNNVIFPLVTDYESKLPYYITGIGYYYDQEHVRRPHGYPSFQWIQCSHGKGELLIEGSVYSVGESQGMLLYPDVPHEYYAVGDTWKVNWVIFGGLHVADFLQHTAGIRKSGVYFISNPDVILSNFRNALALEESSHIMKSLDYSRIAYDILVDIMKYSSVRNENSMDYRYNRLKPVFEYIDRNHEKNLSLAGLSGIAGVTPQHFCILFKQATSLRVFEYINFIRIKKSKQFILQNREMQVKEIARLSGYDDVSYFCSQFKKIEQVSPGEFKRLHI